MGDTVLKEAAAFDDVDFSSYLVTTRLESLYEGITISSVAGPRAQHHDRRYGAIRDQCRLLALQL
jgi:hypothetical protein